MIGEPIHVILILDDSQSIYDNWNSVSNGLDVFFKNS